MLTATSVCNLYRLAQVLSVDVPWVADRSPMQNYGESQVPLKAPLHMQQFSYDINCFYSLVSDVSVV